MGAAYKSTFEGRSCPGSICRYAACFVLSSPYFHCSLYNAIVHLFFVSSFMAMYLMSSCGNASRCASLQPWHPWRYGCIRMRTCAGGNAVDRFVLSASCRPADDAGRLQGRGRLVLCSLFFAVLPDFVCSLLLAGLQMAQDDFKAETEDLTGLKTCWYARHFLHTVYSLDTLLSKAQSSSGSEAASAPSSAAFSRRWKELVAELAVLAPAQLLTRLDPVLQAVRSLAVLKHLLSFITVLATALFLSRRLDSVLDLVLQAMWN